MVPYLKVSLKRCEDKQEMRVADRRPREEEVWREAGSLPKAIEMLWKTVRLWYAAFGKRFLLHCLAAFPFLFEACFAAALFSRNCHLTLDKCRSKAIYLGANVRRLLR